MTCENLFVKKEYFIAKECGKKTLAAFALLLCAAILTVLTAGCGRNESGTDQAESAAEIPFEFVEENGCCKITGLADASPTQITIPEEIDGKPVTVIDDDAFRNRDKLTHVTIPPSVTRIGNFAFECCTGLTEITLPASVTDVGMWAFRDCDSLSRIEVDPENQAYSSEDGALFDKNKTELLVYPKGKKGAFVLPSSVTKIGDWTFSGCRQLTGITIPSSVTAIGKEAFYNCQSLCELNIPSSVTDIGNEAFYNCVSLTEIELPSSVTAIGSLTFKGCTGLKKIVIPSSVKKFGSWVFNGCENLTIYGEAGSLADQYAQKHHIPFVAQ